MKRRQLTPYRASVADRLEAWSMPEPNSGCTIWIGTISRCGYARLIVRGKTKLAHRLAYEEFVGPIPDGLVIDHICRNRACINVRHMEVVTQKENILRGTAPAASNVAKSSCVHGHPFDTTNTRYYVENGHTRRQCVACVRERDLARTQSGSRRAARAALKAAS